LAPTISFSRVIASKISVNAFGKNLNTHKIDEITTQGFFSYNTSKACHMTETFKDIHAAIAAHGNKNLSDVADHSLDPLKRRKLSRMQIVRKIQENNDMPPLLIGNHRRIIEQRNKDLRIIEFYRNETKHDQIINKLNEFITTEYAIYPNFGIVEFFEFVLTNPFNESQVITIIIEDPDIQVVTNSKEWRHLKLIHQIYSQVEDGMFHREEIDQNYKYPQLFLRPKETLNVPFKFQTFKANNQVENNELDFLMKQSDSLIRNLPPKYDLKQSNIFFKAQDKNPIAILRLIIDQQPHVVNHTFRFNECEQSFLKKTIRIPSSTRVLVTDLNGGLSDIKIEGTSIEPGVSQLFVRTSDNNVICESRPVSIGEPHDIYIKAPTGSSPLVKKFYISIYADQFLAIPLQIWQIYVHSMQRVDISCTQGQTSRFSLILKGTQSSRLVRCFTSLPAEMSVVPQDKFMLASNTFQELNIGVQPSKSGLKHFYLNVVDTEMSSLVHSWFINVNCKPPVISKSFELQLPISANSNMASMTALKRVSYSNPYSTEKVFILSTNRDDLLTFKERRIKFAANEQKTLALKFLPCTMAGFIEIYVFINNEKDTNEETFSLRVHYLK
jgi:nephrocystin-4